MREIAWYVFEIPSIIIIVHQKDCHFRHKELNHLSIICELPVYDYTGIPKTLIFVFASKTCHAFLTMKSLSCENLSVIFANNQVICNEN